MARVSYTELKSQVASIVTKAKISNKDFEVTKNNIVGLVDKIGKIYTLDTNFAIDKLSFMDAEFLSFGKTIEEWSQDLIKVQEYDEEGKDFGKPNFPTYRPTYYSYTTGRRKVKTSLLMGNIEKAVHDYGELNEIVSTQIKRISDSYAQYKYALKRELLGKGLDLVTSTLTEATPYATGSEYEVNALMSQGGVTYIAVKPVTTEANTSLNDLLSNGYVVALDLIKEIAKPTTTETGEDFIEAVKSDLEKASDSSEGHSLNGNTLGATESLVLIVKQGVIPAVEVKTYAGAFNRDDVTIPATIHVVKDFGTASSEYYAILTDSRTFRAFLTYEATREDSNGDGDFVNIIRHFEHTLAMSRNTFIRVYKEPTGI